MLEFSCGSLFVSSHLRLRPIAPTTSHRRVLYSFYAYFFALIASSYLPPPVLLRPHRSSRDLILREFQTSTYRRRSCVINRCLGPHRNYQHQSSLDPRQSW